MPYEYDEEIAGAIKKVGDKEPEVLPPTHDIYNPDDLGKLYETHSPTHLKNLAAHTNIRLTPKTSAPYKMDAITRAQFKARIAFLFADNNYQRDIAATINEEFGTKLSSEAVAYHVKQMISYWQGQIRESIDRKQALILARLAQIEELAMDAYFRSMEGKHTKLIEKQIERAKTQKNLDALRSAIKEEVIKAQEEGREVNFDDSELVEALLITTAEKIKEYERHETSVGDPRWLQIALDVQEKRCKIWGLYIKDESQMDKNKEFARLSDDERFKRVGALLQNALVARENKSDTTLAEPSPLGGLPLGEAPVVKEKVVSANMKSGDDVEEFFK